MKQKEDPSQEQPTQPSMPRIIVIAGPVDWDMVGMVAEKMAMLAAESRKPVVVQITSPGGMLQCGYAIHDLLTTCPTKIVTEAFGIVGSAATIIFEAGDVRLMAPHARLMVHEVQLSVSEDRQHGPSDLREMARESAGLQAAIERLFEKRTGRPRAKIRAWCKEEKEFSAHEAVRHGFADFVHRRTRRRTRTPAKRTRRSR